MCLDSYIFNEVGLRTTSFGISASGVLEAVGGVFMKGGGGGKPGGACPANEPRGIGGVLVLAGVPGSIPAARNLSRREAASGTGVEDDVGGGL